MKYEMSAADYRRVADKSMSEKDWRKHVKDMAALHGWEVLLEIPDAAYRTLAGLTHGYPELIPVMAALRGWPDLFLGSRRLGINYAIELKTETGKPNKWQQEKIPLLNQCGVVTHIRKPSGAEQLDRLLAVGFNYHED